jgi:hypothetical protein
VGVRDADLTQAGNQQLIYVFSAGNSGSSAGTIGTPGNGKNMITVGASENQRPSDESGSWTDGCGIGPTGADNAMDIISFSSRGPAPGGRVKPETIGPGTHIQGTASTNAGYNGNSVCDQFRPGARPFSPPPPAPATPRRPSRAWPRSTTAGCRPPTASARPARP